MKLLIIILTLLFSVSVYAHADEKIELGLTVQYLQERVRRLQLEFALSQDQLKIAQDKLQAILAEEEKTKEKKK